MGKEPEKRPTNREMLPKAQLRALSVWDVVTDLEETAYILNNGEQLGGVMGSHAKIAHSVLPDDPNPMAAFLSTGAVRFYQNGYTAFDVEIAKEPTDAQIQVLKRIAFQMPQMELDVMDSKGRLVKSYSNRPFGAIMQDARRLIRSLQSDH